MTKHSCQGVPLPKSIVFIGACNPYRKDKKKGEYNGLKLKDFKEKELVYTVNPLPHALLNYVFNFGSLSKADEKKYINNMVKKPFEKIFSENELSEKKSIQDLISLTIDAISEAQDYVREQNDVSSVSLREIRRFTIFYDFFCRYFRNKNNIFSKIDKKAQFKFSFKNIKSSDIYKYAINLSIYICYYLRLTQKDSRKELSKKMTKYFKFDFEEMPKKEQKFIAENITMKKGIAKNTALLENLFALFSCINSKIPLFIVGKPGCSKSLSVQLLFKSMEGENSNNILFKTLPKLFSYSFPTNL